jgi:hypothetical protein
LADHDQIKATDAPNRCTVPTTELAPARLVTHARKKILKIPPGWTRSTDRQRIHALHPA